MKSRIAKYLITGLLGLLPIFIGVYILIHISGWVFLGFNYISDSESPLFLIFSAVVAFSFVFEFGRQISNHQQNVIVNFGEKILSKFPIIDRVIDTIKDFTNMLQGTGKFENLGVARVPFGGGRTNALITNVEELENGTKEYTVFIVTGTFPPVGFVCYYAEDEVELRPEMKAKDVFELQITLGIKGKQKA